MSELEDRVREILVEQLNVDEKTVTPTAELTRDLGADSLDTTELILEFEKAFGIEFGDESAEAIKTVGDIIDYIKSKGV